MRQASLRLQKAVFREREGVVAADDEVVVYLDVDGLTGLFEPLGDELIVFAGCQVARGVIVNKNDRRRIPLQNQFDDLPWIDRAGGECPLEKGH